jgi:hypothetical protein
MSNAQQKSFWVLVKPYLRKYLPRYSSNLILGILAGILAAASAGFGVPVMVEKVIPIVFGSVPPPAWLLAMKDGVLSFLGLESGADNTQAIILWGAALFIPLILMVRGIPLTTTPIC